MTIVAQVLDNTAISAAQAQADAIGASAVPTIGLRQIVYAAFDGTDNADAIYKSDNPLSSNVAALQTQIVAADLQGSDLVSPFREPGRGLRPSTRRFSPRVLSGVASTLLLVLHPASHAQPRPLNFTPEERAQFSDIARQQRRVELPFVAHNAGAAGWIDHGRVIYSTREITGVWKAEPNEHAKVVVFDIQARTVSETPYRGNLVCFTAERMLVSQPSSPGRPGFNRGLGDLLMAGRFGEPLVPVADTVAKAIVPLDCGVRAVATGPDRDAPAEIPLREGEGLLRVPRGANRVTSSGATAGYQLFDAGGHLVQTFGGTAGFPTASQLHYVPWLRAYFSDKGSSAPSELIWPDGRRRVVKPPALLASFSVAHNVGSAVAAPSRAGILWGMVTWRAYWRMQGIYLLTDAGALKRIDDAHVPAQPRLAVSDDGCRVFYFRRDGDPFNAQVPFVPSVADLCETQVNQWLVAGEAAYAAEEYRFDSADCSFKQDV